MQRLFSTFPNSWPGLGLLILRFATGLSLAAVAHVAGDLAGTASLLARSVVGGVALLTWIGLWTPFAAVAGAAIQVIVITLGHRFDLSMVVSAAVGLSLRPVGAGSLVHRCSLVWPQTHRYRAVSGGD